jgi:uncharacterized membrane protein
MQNAHRGQIALTLMTLILTLLVFQAAAFAEKEDAEKGPERMLTMAAEYPGVVVPRDENVSMDLIFTNKGRIGENVEVSVADKPEGWKTRIKTYRYDVTEIYVPAKETKTLTFEAEPDKGIKPGTYQFRLAAKTRDGHFDMGETIAVTVKEEKQTEAKGVKLTTSYPVIRGPSDATFEFSVEVDSQLDKDAVFDLFAQGPSGWDVNFKPAYESKYITSLRLKSNQNSTIAVEVKPEPKAAAGEYPIIIRVSSGDAKAEAKLTVDLIGTFALEVGTPTGLLSLDARPGKPANLSFYVKNTGSAANHNIKFMSFKPENWKVEFKPESLDMIEPGDLKQVEMIVTPYDEALVGDYSVTVNVDGEKVQKTLESRVTVKASAAWGWIGIGIIVVVIGGLMGLFRWLGRR